MCAFDKNKVTCRQKNRREKLSYNICCYHIVLGTNWSGAGVYLMSVYKRTITEKKERKRGTFGFDEFHACVCVY